MQLLLMLTPVASKSAAAHITPQASTSAAAASELNEDHMNTSPEDTSKDRITCPLCQALLGSGSGDSLLRHLNDYHGDDDEQTPGPPLAMDISLDEMAFINVTLDEPTASPPAASPSAAPPSAASPSAAGMDDESNTSDVDLA